MRIGIRGTGVCRLAWTGALVGGLLIGCGTDESKTELRTEGPPDVLQVFVTERDPGTGATSLGMYVNTNNFGDLWVIDDDGNGVPDLVEDNGDDLAVDNAVVDGSQTMRIIFDELLDGATVERFFCACSNCPNGIASSLDPTMCDDDPDTNVNELGQWEVLNGDGLPDRAELLPGVVTVECDGATVYTSEAGDGFYNPSGNQDVPVATGLAGLGPAMVVTVSTGLKTNAACRVVVASSVTDKDGQAVPATPTDKTFHTEAMQVLTTVPANNATGVALDAAVQITFNALVDEASLANITIAVDGGADVAATATVDMNGTAVTITPNAALTASTKYNVTIPTTVKDKFGGAFPAAATFSFTTGM
jgi:hypothetical protein